MISLTPGARTYLHNCLSHPLEIGKVLPDLLSIGVLVDDCSCYMSRLSHQRTDRPFVCLSSDWANFALTVTNDRGKMICMTRFDDLDVFE